MMKTKLIAALVLLLGLGAWSAGFAQSKRERLAKEFMRDKLALSQQILEGLALEDYDLMIAKGTKLSAMTKDANWRLFENPDYDEQSATFRKQVDALVGAAKKKNLDAAMLAYVRLTISCVDCHKSVRGKVMASLP